MTFKQYLQNLSKPPSEVKRKILERLWKEGDVFPRGWVSSKELLELTGQKYFDRRIRELRDETGCNIETGTPNGEHSYRLLSSDIEVENPRFYLTEAQKTRLFSARKYRCSVCNQEFQPGLRGLQADHKIPLIRGGNHEESNWQPLCVECNVGKRRACAGCALNCYICPWAFPEHTGHRVLIVLAPEIDLLLKRHVAWTGKSVEMCVAEAVTLYLQQKL